jgi:hypothetical protein
MNHIQELTSKIRTALPRLMQLEVGCIVSEGFETYEVIHMDSKGITVVGKKNELHYYTTDEAKDLKIEGKEPMIVDVLEWFNLTNNHNLYYISIKGYLNDRNGLGKVDWNLQQNQETIEFLNKLK